MRHGEEAKEEHRRRAVSISGKRHERRREESCCALASVQLRHRGGWRLAGRIPHFVLVEHAWCSGWGVPSEDNVMISCANPDQNHRSKHNQPRSQIIFH